MASSTAAPAAALLVVSQSIKATLHRDLSSVVNIELLFCEAKISLALYCGASPAENAGAPCDFITMQVQTSKTAKGAVEPD